MKVRDIPEDFQFISDSQDTQPIKDMYRHKYANNYDSFFVKEGDGDYSEIYGMFGIVPNLDKQVFKIYID